MSHDHTMDCERVLALVPTFVDEEVSEALGSAVRRHLIDCAPCRIAVQGETALRQWFVPTEEIEVPPAFAARVARLAAEGGVVASGPSADPDGPLLTPVSPPSGTRLRAVPAAGETDARPSGARTLSFVMTMTAVAAAVLMVFTLLLASQERFDSDPSLVADESVLEELEQENRQLEAEAARAAGGDTTPAAERAPAATGADAR